MRIGLLDIDTKKEKNNRESVEKYPNPAVGKIYGYHMERGDEVVYPWDIKNPVKVDKLYISTIFSWSRNVINDHMPLFHEYAEELLIGGSGWDDYTPGKFVITDLPPEIKAVDHRWTYKLYDIDYSIGKTSEGCHVQCGWCMVWRKEGAIERRVNRVEEILNPKYYERDLNGNLKYPGSNHLVLMNNNSLADPGFYDDVEAIRELKLSVHWDQANDITLINEKNAAALASVNYRGFSAKKRALYFAADAMVKHKIDPATGQKVTYDMLKVIPEKVRLLFDHGVRPSHLNWYMLIGFNTTLEEDLARFNMLNDLKCNVFAMVFRDLNGKPYVDWQGKPQAPHVRPLRDWVNGHAFRNVPFNEFDRYVRALKKAEELKHEQLELF
jgi:hypothetical protein